MVDFHHRRTPDQKDLFIPRIFCCAENRASVIARTQTPCHSHTHTPFIQSESDSSMTNTPTWVHNDGFQVWPSGCPLVLSLRASLCVTLTADSQKQPSLNLQSRRPSLAQRRLKIKVAEWSGPIYLPAAACDHSPDQWSQRGPSWCPAGYTCMAEAAAANQKVCFFSLYNTLALSAPCWGL